MAKKEPELKLQDEKEDKEGLDEEEKRKRKEEKNIKSEYFLASEIYEDFKKRFLDSI